MPHENPIHAWIDIWRILVVEKGESSKQTLQIPWQPEDGHQKLEERGHIRRHLVAAIPPRQEQKTLQLSGEKIAVMTNLHHTCACATISSISSFY